jgi:hypothetical protein
MTNLRLLSLGAGVQSTALALMAIDGTLDRLDGAIFADTGWEPRRVYDHLAQLGKALEDAGIPLYLVSGGNLRNDSLDPAHRYASVPYFVRNPDGSEGMGRRQCTSEYKLSPINRKVRELLGAVAPDFDAAIRKGGARGLPLNGEAFLHRSRVPLTIAPIDKISAAEWKAGVPNERGEQQVSLFELGDPDGCSPYGCRSGIAA